MTKFFNKLILLIYIIFLTSCGYSPIMSKKDYNFKIEVEKSSGNQEVNEHIKTEVKRIDGKNIYFLLIDSEKDKIIISKDSKGDPSILEIKISVNYKIKYNNQIILERRIIKNSTYNNITDKFELQKFEESLTKSLSKNIANGITGSVFSLIK